MNRQNSLSYMPGLDGLRALAVVAVIVYHANKSWLTGGFLGVEVFFVISGYLITRIVQTEIAQGRFRFARFYERRVRRIFPALFVMALATSIAALCLLTLPLSVVTPLSPYVAALSWAAGAFGMGLSIPSVSVQVMRLFLRSS